MPRKPVANSPEARAELLTRLSALGSVDLVQVTSITTGDEMWSDLSDDALRILSEDARAIWNLLGRAQGIPTLDSFPPIAAELQATIDDRGYEQIPAGLLAGVGSFDATRPDAAAATQGGDIGEQNRQIVDAVRNVRTLSQLWLAVNGHEPFWRIVLGATVTAAARVDLLLRTILLFDVVFAGMPRADEPDTRPYSG